MSKYKVSGEIFRWGAPSLRRSQTVVALDEEDARRVFINNVMMKDHKVPHVNYVVKVAEKDPTKTSQKLDALPEPIQSRVRDLLKVHRINKFSFHLSETLYLAEDATYIVWTEKGGWNTTNMGGEWGGYKTGAAGAVGQSVPIPVGGFVIEDEIFLGKKVVTVYHNNGQVKVGR